MSVVVDGVEITKAQDLTTEMLNRLKEATREAPSFVPLTLIGRLYIGIPEFRESVGAIGREIP